MEITWHGDTCFALKGKGIKMLINPGEKIDKNVDFVLSSLQNDMKGFDENVRIFDWPGEYECKGVPIIGFRAWTKSKSKEEEDGEGDLTIIFYFEIEGIKICHLGDLGHVLTSEMVNKIGDVDVLMISVGGNSNLKGKKTMEVIEAIDPRAVVPMGTDNPGAFLKEIGSENVETLESFELKSAADLPEDKRKYIVLNKQ